jgi:hypothetical protein
MSYKAIVEQSKARRMSLCVHYKNESCEALYMQADGITRFAIMRCPFNTYPRYTRKEKVKLILIKLEIAKVNNYYIEKVSQIAAEQWPSTNLNDNKYFT